MKVVARGPESDKLQDLKLSQEVSKFPKVQFGLTPYARKEERALATTPPVGFAMVPPSPTPPKQSKKQRDATTMTRFRRPRRPKRSRVLK